MEQTRSYLRDFLISILSKLNVGRVDDKKWNADKSQNVEQHKIKLQNKAKKKEVKTNLKEIMTP